MTLEMKLAEERKEGYEEGVAAGYENGAAVQRAKDEAELKILKDKQVSDEAELKAKDDLIARYQKLYGKLDQ